MQAFAMEHPFLTFFMLTACVNGVVLILRGHAGRGER